MLLLLLFVLRYAGTGVTGATGVHLSFFVWIELIVCVCVCDAVLRFDFVSLGKLLLLYDDCFMYVITVR